MTASQMPLLQFSCNAAQFLQTIAVEALRPHDEQKLLVQRHHVSAQILVMVRASYMLPC